MLAELVPACFLSFVGTYWLLRFDTFSFVGFALVVSCLSLCGWMDTH